MSGVGLQTLTAVAQALGVPAFRHDIALGENRHRQPPVDAGELVRGTAR